MSILLGICLKATLLLAGAWLAARLLAWRGASAAFRHLVWTVAVLGLLILPLLSVALPAWRVAVPGVTLEDPSPEIQGSPAIFGRGEAATASTPTGKAPAASASARPVWSFWATGIWAFGALSVLSWLGAGHGSVRRLVRRSTPLTGTPWTDLLAEARNAQGVRRPVALVLSGEVPVAMTWGTVRPVVILPAGAVSWCGERRRAVLLHELAHVARLDGFTQALAQVACALYWFHPGVWLAERRMRSEREPACDDRVLALGVPARGYASHLLELAWEARPARLLATAAATMACSRLEERLLSILDETRSRRAVPVLAAAVAVFGALVLLAPLAALHPAPAPLRTAAWSCAPVSGPEPYYPFMTGLYREEDGRRMHHLFKLTGPQRCLEGTFVGGLRVAEDDRDVFPAPGTEALVREKREGRDRVLVTRGLPGGGVERTYEEDGRPRPFDAAAEAWFRSLLPEVVRGSGVAAPQRVRRIYTRAGLPGVFEEIARLPYPGAKVLYFEALVAELPADPALLREVVRRAESELSPSDAARVRTAAAARVTPSQETTS